MGGLLEAGPGTARVEVRGASAPIRGRADVDVGERVGLHEPNSPALVDRVVGVLEVGGVPVLAHPRWPAAVARAALRRAGAGATWRGHPIATLLFTSGSTAAPKVVAHSMAAHLAAAAASGDRVPYGSEHRWLLSLPLCHVGGLSLLFRTVVAGATLVLPEPNERLCEAVTRTRPSHLSLVATQLRDLLADPEACEALAACDEVLLGGGPAPEALLQRSRALGVRLRRTYGMTEMASQIATEDEGRVLPLRGVECRTDEVGQLWVRGPSLFEGYVEDDEVTRPFEDGWFATGDLGQLSDARGLEIHGRRDNQFVSGGENVRPEAVEAALAERGVAAIVVPICDARYGARPVAFTEDGVARDEVAARALPDFARPVAWLQLPTTDGLKPRRHELTELAAARLANRR